MLLSDAGVDDIADELERRFGSVVILHLCAENKGDHTDRSVTSVRGRFYEYCGMISEAWKHILDPYDNTESVPEDRAG